MTAWKDRRIHYKICACGCEKEFSTRRNMARFINGHAKRLYKGEKSDKWKGGIIKDRGYIFIYSPNHPHQHRKYVKRSRLEMEKKLGRFLECWEFIHHINGIRDDDRIENLLLTTLSAHNHIHKPISPEQWSKKYRTCQSCKTSSSPHHAFGLCRICYRQKYLLSKK